jgi:hypothetical protein
MAGSRVKQMQRVSLRFTEIASQQVSGWVCLSVGGCVKTAKALSLDRGSLTACAD